MNRNRSLFQPSSLDIHPCFSSPWWNGRPRERAKLEVQVRFLAGALGTEERRISVSSHAFAKRGRSVRAVRVRVPPLPLRTKLMWRSWCSGSTRHCECRGEGSIPLSAPGCNGLTLASLV